jgi:hypothetical protein
MMSIKFTVLLTSIDTRVTERKGEKNCSKCNSLQKYMKCKKNNIKE